MNDKVDLSTYNNDFYDPGSLIARIAWQLISAVFFETVLPWPNRFKCMLLRFFGARIGNAVIIKPNVKIKFPWRLIVGDHVWIGEQVWIDNLDIVTLQDSSCVSQGAYLLTGNHNYRKTTFDLMIAPVLIEQGAWVCAKAVVCPGVTVGTHAVLSVGSVATEDLQSYWIYKGVPAQKHKERLMESR